MENERHNRRVWNGSPGWYEIWFITLNDGDRGYWIRTTILAPREGEPEGALWFIEFVPGQPPRAWKKTIAPPEGFVLQGGAGEASWDLRVTSDDRHFRPLPWIVRGLLPSKIVTPHLDARISGTIRIGSEERRLEEARGTQTHSWGTGFPKGWAWAHANFDGGVLEAMAERKFGRPCLFARHEKRNWKLNTLTAMLRNRSIVRPDPTGWTFAGTTYNREMVGKIVCDPQHLAGLTYETPAGDKVYCYNSEIAGIELTLRTRPVFGAPWTAVAEISGPAHYEIAVPEPIEGLPLLL